MIKVQVYNHKIRFIRLTMLGKPTEYQIEINGNEIASVEAVNVFLGTSITVNTHSRGKFNFGSPKKHREEVVRILNGMMGQHNP